MPYNNNFPPCADNTAPSNQCIAITPSDTVAFVGGPCRGIYVGVTGDITLIPAVGGAAVLFKAVPVGILPVMALRVNTTATTATNMVALY